MKPDRTMTLNLSEQEMKALEEMSRRKDLSKTAVIRQALRLYQSIDIKILRGGKLYQVTPDGERMGLVFPELGPAGAPEGE